jgi:hypothetical protein
MLKRMAQTHRKFTVHSRLLSRGSVDGRSREGRFLRAVRAELSEMVGNPTPAENVAIERAAWLRLHIALIDERVAAGAILSAHDMRSYTAYSSTLLAAMRRLRNSEGKTASEPPGPTLAEHLARKYGTGAAA